MFGRVRLSGTKGKNRRTQVALSSLRIKRIIVLLTMSNAFGILDVNGGSTLFAGLHNAWHCVEDVVSVSEKSNCKNGDIRCRFQIVRNTQTVGMFETDNEQISNGLRISDNIHFKLSQRRAIARNTQISNIHFKLSTLKGRRNAIRKVCLSEVESTNDNLLRQTQ
jgi:hypothetical protein